jgi:hypothetical protein
VSKKRVVVIDTPKDCPHQMASFCEYPDESKRPKDCNWWSGFPHDCPLERLAPKTVTRKWVDKFIEDKLDFYDGAYDGAMKMLAELGIEVKP